MRFFSQEPRKALLQLTRGRAKTSDALEGLGDVKPEELGTPASAEAVRPLKRGALEDRTWVTSAHGAGNHPAAYGGTPPKRGIWYAAHGAGTTPASAEAPPSAEGGRGRTRPSQPTSKSKKPPSGEGGAARGGGGCPRKFPSWEGCRRRRRGGSPAGRNHRLTLQSPPIQRTHYLRRGGGCYRATSPLRLLDGFGSSTVTSIPPPIAFSSVSRPL
ncbi:MAG: hypothetical protein LBM98_06585 [Oscillospiraceae bacterium]|nr:hypothetical protein [Oscillospiraceae bacterium]